MELSNEEIKEILLSNGFEIKTGSDDLRPYVYVAVRAVIAAHEANRGSEATMSSIDLSDEEIDLAQESAYFELVKTGFNGVMGGFVWDRASARAVIAANQKHRAK